STKFPNYEQPLRSVACAQHARQRRHRQGNRRATGVGVSEGRRDDRASAKDGQATFFLCCRRARCRAFRQFHFPGRLTADHETAVEIQTRSGSLPSALSALAREERTGAEKDRPGEITLLKTAMANFNKVMLMGNLTRDPEVRYTTKGTAVAEIGLAVNRIYSSENNEKREETTFVDVTLWGRTAEVAGEYLKKGRPVFIEGRLQLDSWEDKQSGQKRSKLRVVAEGMQLIGS